MGNIGTEVVEFGVPQDNKPIIKPQNLFFLATNGQKQKPVETELMFNSRRYNVTGVT